MKERDEEKEYVENDRVTETVVTVVSEHVVPDYRMKSVDFEREDY